MAEHKEEDASGIPKKVAINPKDFRFPCPWCGQEYVVAGDAEKVIGKIWTGVVVLLRCTNQECGKTISVGGNINVNLMVNRAETLLGAGDELGILQ